MFTYAPLPLPGEHLAQRNTAHNRGTQQRNTAHNRGTEGIFVIVGEHDYFMRV